MPRSHGDHVEFGNQLISSKLLHQFTTIQATSYPSLEDTAVLVLETTAAEGNARLPDAPHITHMRVDDSTPWVEDQSVWSGLVPVKAIATIVDWIAAP